MRSHARQGGGRRGADIAAHERGAGARGPMTRALIWVNITHQNYGTGPGDLPPRSSSRSRETHPTWERHSRYDELKGLATAIIKFARPFNSANLM
ncbi:hypothetical protein EVAR_22585_1 [Eumeta japonica]|uniref:Uncharacterized protein n=1 Tax=Eumeta variegata TaxID=151549 RepID=A0A4C1U7K2_EUMVA|nr:hypothetical protein EVAR_22585_1 [Eumeta japonica]